MNFHVLTLFPEMIGAALGTSITGRAMEKGLLSLDAVNIRDFAEEKRKSRIDDYPYGGGAGMVMQAEPVYRAYRSVMDRICEAAAAEKNPAVDEAADCPESMADFPGTAENCPDRAADPAPREGSVHDAAGKTVRPADGGGTGGGEGSDFSLRPL